MASQDYREISAIAQQRRAAAIPKDYLLPHDNIKNLPKNVTSVALHSGYFAHDEIEIIESEAEDILQKIRERIWTAVEVAGAFCKAAAVAQQLTNCLTEILFTEALARAEQLDNHLSTTGQILGPLHGLPISLKDCFITPPHPSSLGMSVYANVPTSPEQQTTIVSHLLALGAIIFCKTNTPTAMMMMETTNHVWGETLNPQHTGLSAGGSSGGEAALQACKGSPLGIGTDIGGSIRIPAAYCGLYGLKPSYGRYPQWGNRSGIPGQDYIFSVNGPMSRSLNTLSLYSAALLGGTSPTSSPWTSDPKCLPIPWRTGSHIHPKGRRLRLAIVPPHDGVVTAHPPVERALSITRQALEVVGHEVLDWLPESHAEIVQTVVSAFFGFGGGPIIEQAQQFGEPIWPSMKGYESAASAAANGENVMSADKIREMNLLRNLLQKKYLDRWQATADIEHGKHPVDGVIMAVSPWAACRLGVTNSKENMAYFGYTGVWSLLDLPACTFPVTTASRALDKRRKEFHPLNDRDGRIQEDYDPDFYDGAPVGLQCVGERLEEEKLLEVVGLIKAALDEVRDAHQS